MALFAEGMFCSVSIGTSKQARLSRMKSARCGSRWLQGAQKAAAAAAIEKEGQVRRGVCTDVPLIFLSMHTRL